MYLLELNIPIYYEFASSVLYYNAQLQNTIGFNKLLFYFYSNSKPWKINTYFCGLVFKY